LLALVATKAMPLLDNTLPLFELIMQINRNLLVLNPFAYNIMAKVKHGIYMMPLSLKSFWNHHALISLKLFTRDTGFSRFESNGSRKYSTSDILARILHTRSESNVKSLP
jgi:hypothetical protein